MNINANAITVLAYGDSNTYGQKPDRSGRFDSSTRWTGVLQAQLGDSCYVIEEGLGGRTTDLDHPNPNKPNRNGLSYFAACLESHSPLDIIIIMLGMNDFKTVYNRSTEDISEALAKYLDCVNTAYADASKKPSILLVSPPYMDDTASEFYTSMPTPGAYDETSIQKSHELASHIRNLADTTGSYFFDSAQVAAAGMDGVHLSEQSHGRLGRSIAPVVQLMSSERT